MTHSQTPTRDANPESVLLQLDASGLLIGGGVILGLGFFLGFFFQIENWQAIDKGIDNDINKIL